MLCIGSKILHGIQTETLHVTVETSGHEVLGTDHYYYYFFFFFFEWRGAGWAIQKNPYTTTREAVRDKNEHNFDF